ncbi:hypothetical protein [Micromonospora tarensis]|uniref:DUF222 domain-containing protein n=1 Tax=Micromonospora tarensis TaxID=2806100 RepID=A0ABS1YD60_9ACTN|nr:hypothetical protein [Micromonospora tarensis]MBM0275347.1 hypothetical protein [Micromonospora tarensis]
MTDDADRAITRAIDAHTATYHPGQPCSEDPDGRCAALLHRVGTLSDRIPLTRPVSTTRERLTDARTCGHTPEQHRHTDGQAADDASHDRAMRKVIAQLKQARFDLAAAQELIAVVDDAAERIDRARARYATAPEMSPTEVDPEPLEPTAGEARRQLDQAITNALPLAGRRVSDLLQALQGELARVDSGRAAIDDEAEEPPGSPSPRAQDDTTHPLGKLIRAASAVYHARDTVLPRREALADLAAVADEVGDLDEQALRDRVEHAIRARLADAWVTLPIDDVWLDQVAAVAAVAAVQALTDSEG